MEPIGLKQIEEKAISVFGEKVAISYAQIRVVDKGYIVRFNIQGLPFEISASAENLESAEEQATNELVRRMCNTCANDLFKTQPDEYYERIELSGEELDKLYRFEEHLSEKYFSEIKEKTTVWICQLRDKRYECVLESPYKNLHARGVGYSQRAAIMSAIWKAHDIFEPELIRVGQDIMK